MSVILSMSPSVIECVSKRKKPKKQERFDVEFNRVWQKYLTESAALQSEYWELDRKLGCADERFAQGMENLAEIYEIEASMYRKRRAIRNVDDKYTLALRGVHSDYGVPKFGERAEMHFARVRELNEAAPSYCYELQLIQYASSKKWEPFADALLRLGLETERDRRRNTSKVEVLEKKINQCLRDRITKVYDLRSKWFHFWP